MSKSLRKPKLTDAERHERFVAMAKEVGATEEAPGFDDAIKKVASTKTSAPRQPLPILPSTKAANRGRLDRGLGFHAWRRAIPSLSILAKQ
jgi:hypothetical protein